MTLDILKIPYTHHEVDLLNGGNRTPEYLKLNPQHTVPVYKDGNFVLNESRAILTYLATTNKNEKLYPKEPKVRAKVDSRLFTDMSFTGRMGAVFVS